MKKTFLALTFTFAALTGALAQAAEPTVDVRSESGYLVRVPVSEIKASYKQIVESELENLEKIAQAEQDIYKFAFESSGLNMSPSEARKFAERLAQNTTEPELQKVVVEAGKYAYSDSGLNMSHSEASKFIELLCSFPQAQQRLALHKKSYAFAFSSSGMNLSPREARIYADQKSGLVTK